MSDDLLVAYAIIESAAARLNPNSAEYALTPDNQAGLANDIRAALAETEPLLPNLRPGYASEPAQHLWSEFWRGIALARVDDRVVPAGEADHPFSSLVATLAALTRQYPAILYLPAFDALAWKWTASPEQLNLPAWPAEDIWPDEVTDQPQTVLDFVDALARRIVALLGAPPAGFDARSHLILLFFDRREPPDPRAAERPSGADAHREYVRAVITRRYRMRRTYEPTGQRILLGNSCTSDHPVRITSAMLRKLIPRAADACGDDAHDVVTAIHRELRRREEALFAELIHGRAVEGHDAWTLKPEVDSLKQALIVTLAYARLSALGNGRPLNSRFQLKGANKNHIWDAMDDLLAHADPGEVGGGAAAGAIALARQHEKGVHLVAPFLQPIMAKVVEAEANVLWYEADGNGNAPKLRPFTADEVRGQSKGQPENRNPILEFTAHEELVYCPHCHATIVAPKTDRTIMRSSFMWFQEDGTVDRNRTQAEANTLAANGFFTFDNSLRPDLDTDALARQAADMQFNLFLISGLQNMSDVAHERALKEIDLLRATGTCAHVEIGSEKALPRLFRGAQGRFDSIGIGEELTVARRHAQAVFGPPGYDPAKPDALDGKLAGKSLGTRHVMEALELARWTGIPRIYFHGEHFDIVARRGRLNTAERHAEIDADLIAKWIVLRKLMARNVVTRSLARDAQTRLRREGLDDLLVTVRELKELLPGLDRQGIELDGAYVEEYNATVILTPVRWVYGDLQGLLRIIGAGDTSSFINATLALKGTQLQERI